MGQELTHLLCPECGTSGESDPQAGRWQCSNCGNGFFLRRCSACTRANYVDGLQGFHIPWACTWCGKYNKGFSQNQDPATVSAAELAAEPARYGSPGTPSGPGNSEPDRSQSRDMAAVAGPARADARSPVQPPPPAPGTRVPGSLEQGPLPVPPQQGQMVVRGIALSSGQGQGQGHGMPRSGWRAAQRITLSVAAVVACATAVLVLLTAGGPRAAGMSAAGAGQGPGTRIVQVTDQAEAVNLQGVSGQLAIVGTGPGKVTLTGQVQGSHDIPVVATRLDRATNILTVSIRCASASPCTQNLRLAVPADTGIVVQQPSGQVEVTGLAGSLQVTGTHVNVNASGLRSPDLTAVITNGHLNAGFTVPPQQVSITLTAAQAALRLPGQVAYQVNQQVTSGHVHVAIPQATGAPRTVTAHIQSSELELLTS